MTGLQFIRARSNFSLSELAEILGVSRQIISVWENGNKTIPESRLQELADFFGLDKKYFENLDEVKKQELIETPMFKYIYKGKPKFLFQNIPQEWQCGRIPLYFFDERQETIEERTARADKIKKECLRQIEGEITGPDSLQFYERIHYMNRRCEEYQYITEFLEHRQNVPIRARAYYFIEMRYIMDAMEIAFGIRTEQEIKEKYEKTDKDIDIDLNFIFSTAKFLKEHWESVIKKYGANDKKVRNKRKLPESKMILEKKTSEEMIADAKEVYKRFKEEGGESELFMVWE